MISFIKSVFLQQDFWSNENYSKNKLAFKCLSNEQEYEENVRKTIMSCMESRTGSSSMFKIGSYTDEHEEFLRKLRDINDEENIKDFMEWFHDKYHSKLEN